MSVPAILIGLALILVSITIVARPLVNKRRLDAKVNFHGEQRSYEQILLALRDLDFDHQLGIVAEADYQQLRAQLLAEAAEAYEQMTPAAADLEQLIETAVSDRRRSIGSSHDQCGGCGAKLDPADKYCAACGIQASGACPRCKQLFEHGDKFCASCGAQLVIVAGAVA